MSQIFLTHRTKIKRGGPGAPLSIEYEIDDTAIDFPDPSTYTSFAAKLLLAHHKGTLSRGEEANGKLYTLAESTIHRRQEDIKPPSKNRVFMRARKQKEFTVTGKNKNRRDGETLEAWLNRMSKMKSKHDQLMTTKKAVMSGRGKGRWWVRYPQGKGSQGGNTAFVDSGALRDELNIKIENRESSVMIPGYRAAFVLAAEKGKIPRGGQRKDGTYPHGYLPPIYLFRMMPDLLDKSLDVVTEDSVRKFGGGGGLSTLLGKGIGGFAAFALLAGGAGLSQ